MIRFLFTRRFSMFDLVAVPLIAISFSNAEYLKAVLLIIVWTLVSALGEQMLKGIDGESR